MATASTTPDEHLLRQTPTVAVRQVGLTTLLGDPQGGVEVMRLDGAATLLWEAFAGPQTRGGAVQDVLARTGGSTDGTEQPAAAILESLVRTGRLEPC